MLRSRLLDFGCQCSDFTGSLKRAFAAELHVRWSQQRRQMTWLVRLFLGAFVAFGLCIVLGGLWGGYTRAAPCHSAHSFAEGAFFGSLVITWTLGIPIAIIGAIIGAVAPLIFSRKPPPSEACPHCRYPLRAKHIEGCPECGWLRE